MLERESTMRIASFFTCLLWMWMSGIGFSGENQVFELEDGSLISGKVLFQDGESFRIESESLGTVEVKASKIKSICPAKPLRSPEPELFEDPESIQAFMLQDREIMGVVLSLQNDPDFKEALADPEIAEAVRLRDFSALSSNPRFLRLMNHSKVLEIIELLEE
jgi:hypothetical protein